MGLFRRWVPCLLLIAAMPGCSSTSLQQEPLPVAELQEVSGNVPAGYIEIQGVSAGTFDPSYWQNDTLNWVPDVRAPLLPPQATGQYQNIYSPWPLEQPKGWRVFYGGWDGSDTPNDRVYSLTTSDFLTFNNRTLVIDHGVFEHVNNVNVHQLPDGSYHMVCTVAPDQFGWNKPAYFSSPDGVTWNGSQHQSSHPLQKTLGALTLAYSKGDVMEGAVSIAQRHGIVLRPVSDYASGLRTEPTQVNSLWPNPPASDRIVFA